jgi:hypothetical protein
MRAYCVIQVDTVNTVFRATCYDQAIYEVTKHLPKVENYYHGSCCGSRNDWISGKIVKRITDRTVVKIFTAGRFQPFHIIGAEDANDVQNWFDKCNPSILPMMPDADGYNSILANKIDKLYDRIYVHARDIITKATNILLNSRNVNKHDIKTYTDAVRINKILNNVVDNVYDE